MAKRTVIMYVILMLLSGALMTRILFVALDSRYIGAAAAQSSYRLEVCKTRGTIYDCRLRSLAGGRTEYRACVAPSQNTAQHLRSVLTDEEFYAIEGSLQKRTPFVIGVSSGELGGTGVTVVAAETRYGGIYAAPHIVGYLGSDRQGVYGVEKAYNEYLEECGGGITATYHINASGRSLEGVSPVIEDTTYESRAGVVLTLDLELQQLAERAAKRYLTRGAVVLMEIPTGEIRACVSLPDFEPTHIADYLSTEYSPLVNRAFSTYDVGSVFKLVTAAAALESGISPDRRYCCEGCVEVGSNSFHCSDRSGHGEIDMETALALSCNTYFIDLANEIGGERLLAYAQRFGLGEQISLMENYMTDSGRLPTQELLEQPAALANFAFGQGELMLTPVHIAALVAAIANDGIYVEPTLYGGLVDKSKEYVDIPERVQGERIITERTAKVLQRAMRRAVLEGTAKKGASTRNTSAAKTGTAQTGIKENGVFIHQAWYAGYFPYEAPKYVCVVLAENGESGGSSAGPVFAELADNIKC